MADLRDLLQQAAPTPPEFDETALLRMIAKRSYRRRATLAASAIALVALIAIAVGIMANQHSDQRTIIVSPSSTTPTTRTSIPAVADDVRWRALPAAPIAARESAASVWTGSAFVVWGGRDASFRALSDGAWYDPRARRWHSMRASPLGPAASNGFYVGMPLAGDAVIVSGTKAAAYTPRDDSWRVLPDVPLAHVDASALTLPGAPHWVVVSGVDRGGQGALAWLDPANDASWHTIAMHGRARVVLLPNGRVVYWYGIGSNHGVDTDLATGAEHPIPATLPADHGYPFDPGTVAGSLVMSPLAQVAWNATTRAYEDLSYRSTGSTNAVASGYCGGASAWTGHQLLTWGGSECQGNSYLDAGAEYNPSSGALRPLPRFLSGRTGMAFAWTGTELLIWGGQTDSNGHVVADGASLTVGSPALSRMQTVPWIGTALAPNTRDTWAHFIDPGTTRDAPECRLEALLVRASVNGAGGTQYLGVRVQNRSRSACTLVAAPYVRLLDTQGRTIGRLLPDPAATGTLILVPKSWATLDGVIALSSSVCGNNVAAVAFGLNASDTVTVPTSGTPPTASRCGSTALRDQTAPAFAPLVSAFSDPTFLSLSFAALRAGTVLDAPLSVRRGQVLQYSVTITNTGLNSLALETDTLSGQIDGNCPLYRQLLGPTASPSLLLNCGKDGLILQPDEAVRFEMRFAVPADQPLGPSTLSWQYLEPTEPVLTLPITVVDG